MNHACARPARHIPLPEAHHTHCPACGRHGISFLPLPDAIRTDALRYGFKHFGRGEMTAHDTYACDACGASDRERLYALWLDTEIARGSISRGLRLIHFAPEHVLSGKIRASGFFDYHTADPQMTGVDHVVDLMNLPFPDNSFDLFICSHVLEHVENDDTAISELFRIVNRGARSILMAPIIVGLEQTLEDASVTTDAERWRCFGQNDHLRIYAHDDYLRKIKAGGFVVEELGIKYFGGHVFRRLGLKDTSVLYVVSKP